jgi:hypothetical protein
MTVTAAKLRRAAKMELARRARANRLRPPAVKIREVCHQRQAKLVEALVLGPARNICALCGRQSGKSHGAALGALLVAANRPGVNVIYVASTYATCKKMAFLPAVTLNRELGLGGQPQYGQELAVKFPNGSNVYFLGADSEKTVERLRGVPNLVLVIIDEASVYSSDTLAEMIKTVRPGLRPHRGKLCVMGTGSKQGRQGAWASITENPNFDQHRFGYMHNDRVPSHADVEATIDEDLKAQFPDKTPTEARRTAWYRREYGGPEGPEHAVELAELVYKLTDANLVDDIPSQDIHATGGDIGVSANDALVCLGWRDYQPEVYVTDQEERSGQDSIACADMVKAHNTKRHPITIAMDPGGLGQKTIKTVQTLYPEVPITEAQKPPIGIQVRALNTLLQSGRLKIKRGSKLAMELTRPTWVDGIVGGKIDEHGQHSDLIPSLRYIALKALPLLPDVRVTEPVETEADRKLARIEAARREQRRAVGDVTDEDMAAELNFEDGDGGDWVMP